MREFLFIVPWQGIDVQAFKVKYAVVEFANVYQLMKALPHVEKRRPVLSLCSLNTMPTIWQRKCIDKYLVVGVSENKKIIMVKDTCTELLDITRPSLINESELEAVTYYQEIGRIADKYGRTRLEARSSTVVFDLFKLVYNIDLATASHSNNAMKYTCIMLEAAAESGHTFKSIDDELEASLFHDIGKALIPHKIIAKQAALTANEFEAIKHHVSCGLSMLNYISSRILDDTVIQLAKEYCAYHHERWDGRGYPVGLTKNEIPVRGRLMAITDVYDALVSERPYKKAMSHEEALQIICDGAGSHFDPVLVRLFWDVRDKVKAVKRVI